MVRGRWPFLLPLALTAMGARGVEAEGQSTTSPPRNRIVNLGTLQIEGEARQPNLNYVESEDTRIQVLKGVVAAKLRNLEVELLQPATPSNYLNDVEGQELLNYLLRGIFPQKLKNLEKSLLEPATSKGLGLGD